MAGYWCLNRITHTKLIFIHSCSTKNIEICIDIDNAEERRMHNSNKTWQINIISLPVLLLLFLFHRTTIENNRNGKENKQKKQKPNGFGLQNNWK